MMPDAVATATVATPWWLPSEWSIQPISSSGWPSRSVTENLTKSSACGYIVKQMPFF